MMLESVLPWLLGNVFAERLAPGSRAPLDPEVELLVQIVAHEPSRATQHTGRDSDGRYGDG